MPQRKHKARKRAQPPEQRGRKWLYVLAPVVALLIMAGIWFAAKDGQASRPIDAGVTTAETKEPGQGGSRAVELAPASLLTGRVAQAPPAVTGAYRFAIANQDLLSQIPCYCGCVASGHKSNLDCFMQGTNPDGSIIFDDHAFGWTTCVDIARDAMRLWQDGRSVEEIRSYVDREYSQYGPSNDTQPQG